MTVNLATTEGIGGDAEGDTLSGIEIIRGSNFADTLTAMHWPIPCRVAAATTSINGGDGNDVISAATMPTP